MASKKNTTPIRIDKEIFLPELKRFGEVNHMANYSMPDLTRELGKLLQRLRIEKVKILNEIKF